MAVGDEKFRLTNQYQQSLTAALMELDGSEREQLMAETMRQENFGLARDEALTNALATIAQQRTGATLGEAQRLEDVALRQGEILQGQQFTAGEAAKQRSFAAGQAEAQRKFQSRENEISRAFEQEGREEAIRQFNLNLGLNRTAQANAEDQWERTHNFAIEQFEYGKEQDAAAAEAAAAEAQALAEEAEAGSPMAWMMENVPDQEPEVYALAMHWVQQPDVAWDSWYSETESRIKAQDKTDYGIMGLNYAQLQIVGSLRDSVLPALMGTSAYEDMDQETFENIRNYEGNTDGDKFIFQGVEYANISDYLDARNAYASQFHDELGRDQRDFPFGGGPVPYNPAMDVKQQRPRG